MVHNFIFMTSMDPLDSLHAPRLRTYGLKRYFISRLMHRVGKVLKSVNYYLKCPLPDPFVKMIFYECCTTLFEE